MSEKEKILKLLDDVPEDKFGEVLGYLQKILSTETDSEKIDKSAKKILEKHRHAFEVLAQ